MDQIINIRRKPSGVLWVGFAEGSLNESGQRLLYKHHSRRRRMLIDGKIEQVVHCYYQPVDHQGTGKPYVVASHPDIIPNKKVSKSTFAKIIDLKYNQKHGKTQIMKEMPYLTEYAYYESINSFRAASRSTADVRLAEKYPPGTQIRASIDGIEVEKGQPGLYTVRETTTGDLLGAAYLKDADSAGLYELVHGIEEKYGIIYVGFVSDKGKNIIAMHDQYYSEVPIQYCIVHFLKNATKEMREQDQTLQKELRSDVRKMAVLKTIRNNCRDEDSPLDEKERNVLAETKEAVLAIVNQKKNDLFELGSLPIFQNLSKFQNWLFSYQNLHDSNDFSKKFWMILTHFFEQLHDIVENKYIQYRDVELENYYIHPIFKTVRDPHPRHPKRAFLQCVKKWQNTIEDSRISQNVRVAVQKALDFAKSYECGLFVWRKAKLPSHNNGTETFYHLKKGRYRYSSPNMKIGVTMELSGLEELFVPFQLEPPQIRTIIDAIGTQSYTAIRGEMKVRSKKRRFDRHCRKAICTSLIEIFKKLESKN
jgi:hypothetical protein